MAGGGQGWPRHVMNQVTKMWWFFKIYFSSSSESHFQMKIGTELVSVKKKICLSDGHECFGGRGHFGFCSYSAVCQQVYLSLHYNTTQPTTIRVPNGCKCVRRETDYSEILNWVWNNEMNLIKCIILYKPHSFQLGPYLIFSYWTL